LAEPLTSDLKIKKFRIRPRLSSVARILKSILSVKQLSEDVESAIPAEVEAFLPKMMPTAFYQTWPRDEIPSSLQDALKEIGGRKVVALSALVATIGDEPEDVLSGLLMNGERQRSQILTAVCEESADLCLQFLLRLLTEEAVDDDCEVSDPIVVDSGALLAESLALVEAEQEGVSIDTAFHLSPRFTRVALVVWFPAARKKRAQAAPKKRSA
jgi:hypothetical protein